MISFELNGKEYNLPTSFDDIDMETFCRCFHGLEETDGKEGSDLFYATKHNESVIVSRLLGEDDDFCMGLPFTLYEDLASACTFIYRIDDKGHSQFIEIGGKRYTVPEPGKMNLRQWIDIDMTGNEEDTGDKYLQLLSTMLVEVGEDGKPKPYEGADEGLFEKLKRVKASEGISLIYHFFLLGAISSRITQASLTAQEVMNRLRRNIQDSLQTTTGSI